jgi:L-threonylcarbamoyladenylate synthase
VATLRLARDQLQTAANLLRDGHIVAFPTETVYGLGADAANAQAVAHVYAAKGRPSFNPLIAHVSSMQMAQTIGDFSSQARKLAQAFWPGPLTLVVPLQDHHSVCTLARAGLESVGLRVPAHPLARELLNLAQIPIVAPSANRSGHISPTRVEHVLADLDGRIDAVLDGGLCQVGVESTIVACLDGEPVLLRAGGISTSALELVLHQRIKRGTHTVQNLEAPLAPGMLTSHYAPRARVTLNAAHIEKGDAVLLFGVYRPTGIENAHQIINLSESGDAIEAAANLFDALRSLDQSGCENIAVTPILNEGLGEAINDRLSRAAAQRF